MIKVLFQIRPDYLDNPAGDSIQLLKTKEYLKKLGVKVDVSTSVSSTAGYDLVHLFNTTRVAETYRFFRAAKKYGTPVAVSTIYWDFGDFLSSPDAPGRLRNAWSSTARHRKEIFREAGILFPNSRLEEDLIRFQYGQVAPCHVVPNGADPVFARGDPEEFYRLHRMKDFILCVGRISLRKNQLSLAEALRNTGLPLVLAGPVNDREYLRKVISSGENVFFINSLDHQRLPSLYAAARVHALPSWFETPGLASLEAALSGCRVVTTERGSAREYFGDLACYCHPESVESIRNAVLAAFSSTDLEKQRLLKDRMLSHYTWNNVAVETLIGYKKILSKPEKNV
ncbi:MAG: hypothetical protein VR68_07560 [Peptococcaceae bacterium BRH_c4a]|nr:MAG: hypothetical protein VR68_07560 [Peptococcaceae bacterium BRH_c4a]